VNDAAQGGSISTVPAGLLASQGQQNIPGDRIILDDATALALSDTAVGTLYGGVYEYILSKAASTAAPAVGVPAFFLAADVTSTTGLNYEVTPDAAPTAAIPTFFQGVYINALTKGNFGWIQILGTAAITYQATVTGTAAGGDVSVGISQTPPAFDSGVTTFSVTTMGRFVGIAVDAPSNAGTGKKIILTRMPGRL